MSTPSLKGWPSLAHQALIVLFLLIMYPFSAGATPEDPSTRTFNTHIHLGPEMEFVKERQDATIALIRTDASIQWRPLEKRSVAMNYHPDPVWFRSRVNIPDDGFQWYLELDWPILESVDVYQINAEGTVHSNHRTGALLPFSQRPLPLPSYVFPLSPDTKEIYLRVQTNTLFYFTPTLWRDVSIQENHLFFMPDPLKRKLWQGAFYGLMLCMILYNFFIYTTTREPAYIAYVLYCICVTAFQGSLNGVLFQYLWPDNPEINKRFFNISGASTYFSIYLFSYYFLNADRHPRIALFMKFMGATWLLQIINAIILPEAAYVASSSLFSAISLLFAVFLPTYVFIKGNIYGLYFLVAWGFLISSTIVAVLAQHGIITSTPLTLFGGQQLGIAIETIIISLALTHKIKSLQGKEHAARQEELDRSNKENDRLEREVSLKIQQFEQAQKENEQTRQLQRIQEKNAASILLLTAFSKQMNTDTTSLTNGLLEAQHEAIALSHYMQDLLSESDDGDIGQLISDGLKDILSSLDVAMAGQQRLCELKKKMQPESFFNDCLPQNNTVETIIENSTRKLAKAFPEVTVRTEIPSLLPFTKHPEALEECVFQVMKNAYQAQKQDCFGTEPVSISVQKTDDFLRISIQDHGKGMTAEQKNRAFDAFYTTRKVGDGQGLGLTLSKALILRMGGAIDMESTPGHGCTVHMSVPA